MASPLDKTKTLSEEIVNTEAKLLRSTSAGRSTDQTVSARVSGRGQLTELEIDTEAYGLSEKKSAELAQAITEAVDAALLKQRRRVEKELNRLVDGKS